MSRKICVVTGTRAEYGLLRWVMQGISDKLELSLQVIATGMHFSPEFGLTYRAIEADGFTIDRKVESLLSSDSPSGVAKSMGLGLIGIADAFNDLKPDIVVLLGDRFEIFAAAAAALCARIPIAHLNGGEATEGLIDEAIRHSITKMAHLHFVAAPEYGRRVIQLGEAPERVFVVGTTGLDSISCMPLLSRVEIENRIGFRFGRHNLLVTFHPVTLEDTTATQQCDQLLAALSELKDTNIIFTLPNADTYGRAIVGRIESFVLEHSNCRVYKSLGQLLYLSCMQHVDAVVGNSSSGLIEAPSFQIGTINIGDRQRGRLQASSVLNCLPVKADILNAISELYSPQFQADLRSVNNPYGQPGASTKIVETLATFPLSGLLKKTFHEVRP